MRRAALVLVSCLIGVSGCSRRDGLAEASSTSGRGAAAADQPAISPPVALTADQIRALLLGDGPATDVDEQIIVDCMNAAGFEFFAADDDWESEGFGGPEPTLKQVEQAGYGILIDPVEPASSTSEPDPNIAYRDSLTAAERQAYENVFSGNATDVANVAPDSCLGQQMAALDAVEPPVANELYLEILSEFEALVNSDAAIVEARRAWTSCMRESGYSFDSRDEIIEYLFSIEDENGDGVSTPDQQAEERTLAVTDFGCAETERAALPAAEERAADQIIDEYGSDAAR